MYCCVSILCAFHFIIAYFSYIFIPLCYYLFVIFGASKFKVGHVTFTTPLLREICRPYAGT